MRSPQEKSNGIVDFVWCDKFNDWINNCNPLELKLVGRWFTWANNQEDLIMSLIDRVFCITSFDQNFPLAKISALPKNPSDHTPILWESGDSQDSGQPRFKFEKWWLHQEGLEEIVKNT